jgi:tetratricopeptide (TPR) repeat protein
MKTTKLIVAGLAILLAAGAAAAAPYVVLPDGRQLEGTAIRALSDGSINLTTGGAIRTFARGSYVRAFADKPAEYDQAAAAIRAKKYDEAIKMLNDIVVKFRFLHWDVEASKLLGQAYLEKGDAEEAVKAYDRLFQLAPAERQNSETAWAHRRAMLQAKQYAALIRQLDAVAAAGNRPEAARAQIMRGDVQLAQNLLTEAALDYLRTAILFQDVKDVEIQGEAHFKAAAALEQLRDPRAKDLYRKVAGGASRYAAQAKGKI